MLGRNPRLSVNVDDLRRVDQRFARFVLRNPLDAIKMFEDELNAQMKTLQQQPDAKGGEKTHADDAFPRKV